MAILEPCFRKSCILGSCFKILYIITVLQVSLAQRFATRPNFRMTWNCFKNVDSWSLCVYRVWICIGAEPLNIQLCLSDSQDRSTSGAACLEHSDLFLFLTLTSLESAMPSGSGPQLSYPSHATKNGKSDQFWGHTALWMPNGHLNMAGDSLLTRCPVLIEVMMCENIFPAKRSYDFPLRFVYS